MAYAAYHIRGNPERTTNGFTRLESCCFPNFKGGA
jgi:hypothetical protein